MATTFLHYNSTYSPMDKNMYKLLIIDDHPIVAEGIKNIAEQLGDVTCQSAICMKEVEQAVNACQFDLCIIDLELPDTNGFKLIDFLHNQIPECRILIYTMHEEPWVISKLAHQAIHGAVSKNNSIQELATAIKEIKNGNKYFCKTFSEQLGRNSITHIRKVPELSKREKEVLALLSQGLSTSEIANKIFLSTNTVHTYRKRLMEKLEAKNVAELVYKGTELF
jgi:DNA-binding NarL/FixJ family response regulator